MNKKTEYVDCNICQNNKYKSFCTKFGWNLVKCRNCGLIYANPRLPEEEIFKRYGSDYFYKEYLPIFKATAAKYDIEKIKEHYFLYLELLDKYSATGKKILDIGCGPGFFLKAAEKKGWEGEGVEISKAASQYANSTVNIKVHNNKLEAVKYPKNYFDVISLLDTIEHLDNPLKTLKDVHRILKTNGIVILNTPDLNSLSRLFLKNEWAVLSPKEHLYNFTQRTLKRLLVEAGFQIVVIQNLFYFNPEYTHNKKRRSYSFWKSLHRRLEKSKIIEKIYSYDIVELMLSGEAINSSYSHLRPSKLKRIIYRIIGKLFRGDTLVALAQKKS